MNSTLSNAVLVSVLLGGCTLFVNAQKQEAAMTHHAKGTFEPKLTPEADGAVEGLGRMTISKQFHGDLEGSSQGQMLTAMTQTKGSAGYVAIERVTGTLGGRSGSFVLQHNGMLNRGTPQQTVTVVPDSGAGQLSGMAGSMTIRIEDGKHFYDLEYTLPE